MEWNANLVTLLRTRTNLCKFCVHCTSFLHAFQ